MKLTRPILAALPLLILAIGCSGGGPDQTKSAGNEVMMNSDKGGAAPNPNLPAPVAGGGAPKSGKFQPGSPGN